MKFLKLDKKKGSGGPSIKSRYAYLIHIDDIDYLPGTNEKGVRLEGDILLKEDCTMMPLYLTSSSQEFSYDILGDDDEKSYLVKFSGNHPGTELEALEFAKNMIEQPYLVLIPSCNESEPWKLLGELTNPLIFTSSHKGGSDSSKFTFNFEQRIGSEFIYFSYGGVEVPSEGGGGVEPPSGGFDPTKWARIDASNIDPYISQWRTKLGVTSGDHILTIGEVTATANKAYLSLPPELKNEVVINGVNHFRTVPQQFPFTPVVSSLKILIVEAKPDAEVFHLVEGEEGPQAKEPAYTGLFIARLIASPTGVVVEESNTDFKLKLQDYWQNWYVTSPATKQILGTTDARGSFYITKSASAPGSVTIGGLSKILPETEDATKIFYEGREFWIYNATGEPMLLDSTGVSPTDTFLISTKLTPFTVKNNHAVKVKLRGDILELLPSGSDPDLSGYATTAQVETKLTKPETAGTFAVQFDGTNYTYVAVSGENISNANMTWAGNTTQNLGGFKVSFTNGRFSVPAVEMEVKTSYALANSIWFDGNAFWLNPTVGASRRFNTGTTFNYTPTGNFTLSAVKNAMEAAGYNFNDSNVNIILGSNNYTCSIDIGAANIGKSLTIERTGTGSISFSSTRTLDSGADAITIMNGNEISMIRIRFGTSKDFIIIRNL